MGKFDGKIFAEMNDVIRCHGEGATVHPEVVGEIRQVRLGEPEDLLPHLARILDFQISFSCGVIGSPCFGPTGLQS